MKYLKRFNEGLFYNSEDELGKEILNILNDVDGDDIEYINGYISTYEVNISKNPKERDILKVTHDIEMFGSPLGQYEVFLNGDEIKCGFFLKRKIFKKLKDIYTKEKDYYRIQKLKTTLL